MPQLLPNGADSVGFSCIMSTNTTITEPEPDDKMPMPQPGCLKGFWMSPDFDEPLEDFKEYAE
jgi:hypothetical protein